jgi:thioredoxin reductase (NADPH)
LVDQWFGSPIGVRTPRRLTDIDASRTGIPVSPENCQTRRAGIFAIGDIALYPGKLKLILTGFAEAASAAHAARQHIKPNEAFHFEYSTTKGVPA